MDKRKWKKLTGKMDKLIRAKYRLGPTQQQELKVLEDKLEALYIRMGWLNPADYKQ